MVSPTSITTETPAVGAGPRRRHHAPLLSLSPPIQPPLDRRRKRKPWVIAVVVVLVTAGIAVAVADPSSSGAARSPGVAESADSTGLYTVARQDLSSQTQVSATLGYAGSFSIGPHPPTIHLDPDPGPATYPLYHNRIWGPLE